MKKNSLRGEVLVCLLKEKSDFGILHEQGWYRIPVKHAPKRWPPKWLAFYQPKAYGDDAYRIRYYAEVGEINIASRQDLFPNELPNPKSDQEYFKIKIKSLKEKSEPIFSSRPRRLAFIPTTWLKFELAEEINDLFDDSPLEDRLWLELKKLKIKAERQWLVQIKQQFYRLDFATFCQEGQLDIETDGDHWHANKKQIPVDNQRDNDLQSVRWHVLRFNSHQINEQMEDYCVGKIVETINELGGGSADGFVPRLFYPTNDGIVQQLSLFDKDAEEYRFVEADPESPE